MPTAPPKKEKNKEKEKTKSNVSNSNLVQNTRYLLKSLAYLDTIVEVLKYSDWG
jgi:hypothetical protein